MLRMGRSGWTERNGHDKGEDSNIHGNSTETGRARDGGEDGNRLKE